MRCPGLVYFAALRRAMPTRAVTVEGVRPETLYGSARSHFHPRSNKVSSASPASPADAQKAV